MKKASLATRVALFARSTPIVQQNRIEQLEECAAGFRENARQWRIMAAATQFPERRAQYKHEMRRQYMDAQWAQEEAHALRAATRR